MNSRTSTPYLKRIFSILLLFLLFLSLIFYSALPVFAADSSRKPTIRIGWFTLDGYQNIDEDGNHSGYGYEYYQEIAKYTGWHYEYVAGSWSECLTMLKNGEIDILSFIQYTDERKQVYDFTTDSIGSNYAELTTLNTNASFVLDDFTTFDQAKIGALRRSAQIEQLEEYAAVNHFTYQLKLYDELSQLTSALESGEIDALLNHNFRRLSPSEKILTKFAPNTIYCAVKKGNTTLLSELDDALAQIRMNYPGLNSRLIDKYFSINSPKGLILSKEESKYLKSLKSLRVVSSPCRKPLSYFEDGELKGIYRDILDQIASTLNIKFIYIETESYEESLNMLKSGEADIITDLFTDYSWAEQNHTYLTSPYMTLQYSYVQQKKILPDKKTVAAVKSFKFSKDYVKNNYPASNIVWYDNPMECLNAVNSGKQDITFPMTYIANENLRNHRFSNLTASLIPYSHEISIASSMHKPRILNSILDKAIMSMGTEEIKTIIAKYTLFLPQESNLVTYLYQNPIESITILALLSFTVTLLLSIIIKNKNIHNKEFRHMLYIDDITGYPNYRSFQVSAAKLLHNNTTLSYAILYMDIQKFKYINDTFGHAKGDELLKVMSNEIQTLLNEAELFSRIYADHFVFLLQYRTKEELENRAQTLLDSICSKASTWKEHYNLLLKTGIYMLYPGETNIDKAVDSANYAKDTIHDFFSNTLVFYNEEMRTQIQKDKLLEQGMESALHNHEFQAFFQARVDISDYRIVGAEALVRWNHPQKGLLFPDSFIPFFEQNGFITKLDLEIFEQACRRLAKMKEEGIELFPVSCNFSRMHLTDLTLPDRLISITKKYGIPTNMLEVELTETIATDNFELAVLLANKLKNYGFLISIDDFGSGYSSIQLLYRLPLNILKLDKMLIQNQSSGIIEDQVVESLIHIAHNNGIDVVCEGVENLEQEQYVRDHGCRFVQGYLYSKPIPFHSFLQLVLTSNAPDSSSDKLV